MTEHAPITQAYLDDLRKLAEAAEKEIDDTRFYSGRVGSVCVEKFNDAARVAIPALIAEVESLRIDVDHLAGRPPGHWKENLFAAHQERNAAVASRDSALLALAEAEMDRDEARDLTWFWAIVDHDGPAAVPSDEREALSRIVEKATKCDAATARADAIARENAELREVAQLVDAWGNGLRHQTAHESKMVKAARTAVAATQSEQAIPIDQGVRAASGARRYRHLKRGSTYCMIGVASIQTETPLNDLGPIYVPDLILTLLFCAAPL